MRNDYEKLCAQERLLNLICGSPAIKCEWPTGECKNCYKLVDSLIDSGFVFNADEKDEERWLEATEIPPEDGAYLVRKTSFGSNNMSTLILHFSKDARKINDYDFAYEWENVWYDYDSEYGYFVVSGITHWRPIPEDLKEALL